jgi:hypothetical protein
MPTAAHRQRPGFERATRTTTPDFSQMLSNTNDSDTVGAAEVTELKRHIFYKTFLAVLACDVPEGTNIIPSSLFTKMKTDTAMDHCGQPARPPTR